MTLPTRPVRTPPSAALGHIRTAVNAKPVIMDRVSSWAGLPQLDVRVGLSLEPFA